MPYFSKSVAYEGTTKPAFLFFKQNPSTTPLAETAHAISDKMVITRPSNDGLAG